MSVLSLAGAWQSTIVFLSRCSTTVDRRVGGLTCRYGMSCSNVEYQGSGDERGVVL